MTDRILIVEDEELIKDTLQDLLHSLGYVVKSTLNGQEALKTIPLYRPTLIVSDVMMPIMDGISLVKKLKTDSSSNSIPIILLTAKKQFKDRIEGLATGADAYISKPFDFQELTLVIRNLVGLRKNIEMSPRLDQDETDSQTSFVQKLSDFILGELDHSLTLTMAAAHFSLSASGIKQKIKRTTGKPFRLYLREIRLNKARELLLSQTYNISQVASMTGFRSVAHFSDTFKKHFGVSPSNLLV